MLRDRFGRPIPQRLLPVFGYIVVRRIGSSTDLVLRTEGGAWSDHVLDAKVYDNAAMAWSVSAKLSDTSNWFHGVMVVRQQPVAWELGA